MASWAPDSAPDPAHLHALDDGGSVLLALAVAALAAVVLVVLVWPGF